jgi:benzodiazapine receptor
MKLAISSNRSATIVAAAWIFVVALAGGLVTDIGPWYHGLAKPSWQPPDWLFGPAWTVIFVLTASGGVLAWRSVRLVRSQRLAFLAAFVVNSALNILWSVLFFRAQRPDWALIEVGFFWVSVALLIVVARPGPRAAPWLIAPYLAWVSFASFLNYTIVRLN